MATFGEPWFDAAAGFQPIDYPLEAAVANGEELCAMIEPAFSFAPRSHPTAGTIRFVEQSYFPTALA